jgi:hypothetical protein
MVSSGGQVVNRGSVMRSGVALCASLVLACGLVGPGRAQTAATKTFILVPYEEPAGKDPHAREITQTLAAELQKQGLAVKVIEPVDHLDAVHNAPQLCRDNGANAILIPEGRYEQTRKSLYAVFANVVTYPTHVELRLDEFDCSGKLAWTTTATKDEVRSNGIIDPANVGATIDDAFRAAAAEAVGRLAAAPALGGAVGSAGPAPDIAPSSRYVLVPFGQPGIADPRSPDLTRSLEKLMIDRKIDVTTIAPVDRLTVVASAPELCAQNGAGGIVVPDLRLEQSPLHSTHAELRLDLLGCDGRVRAHGFSEADVGNGFLNFNLAAVMVEVTERAMRPALDQLMPTIAAAQGATPGPGPSP